MRIFCFTTFLTFYIFLGFSQDHLDIAGRVRELSVAPDKTIWLTTETGNVYHSQLSDSIWKTNLQSNPNSNYLISAPNMDRILFFNSDTAIIYGYITKNFYEEKKNKIYRTTDGGLNWELIEFGKGDVWIREGQVFEDGKVWLSGSKGFIYQSVDYGETWITLPSIFKKEKEAYYRKPDIYSFHYADDSSAIATNRSNHLAVTTSNFNVHKYISTPLDQGLFEKKYKSYYLNGGGRKYVYNWKIDKVRHFGKYYVIMQNGNLYYTEKELINWKKLNDIVINFEMDNKSKRLYLINDEFEVKEVDSNFNLIYVNQISSLEKPIDLKVVDDIVFILVPNYVSKISKDKVRDQYGNLTVVEKNYRRLEKYIIFAVGKNKIEKKQILSH